MEKISFPKGIDHNVIDLDFSLKKNLSNLADSKNKKFESLRICVLDRPRHKKIIDEAKSLNIDVKLISDGDVSGALLVTDEKSTSVSIRSGLYSIVPYIVFDDEDDPIFNSPNPKFNSTFIDSYLPRLKL